MTDQPEPDAPYPHLRELNALVRHMETQHGARS